MTPIPRTFRTAVVVGASRGIGRGIALALGAAGARVYVAARTASEGGGRWPGSVAATVRDVDLAGGAGVEAVCDAFSAEQLEQLFGRVARESGAPDLLVNCAYAIPDCYPDTPRGIPFWELPESIWELSMRAGPGSAYLAARLAAPLMIEKGAGVILNVSSAAAESYAFGVAHGVAKAALERMTRDMALELRPYGVAVVAFRPGPVLTERIRLSPWVPSAGVKRRSPEDVGGRLVAYLQETDLLPLTGSAVELDGSDSAARDGIGPVQHQP